MNKKYRLLIIVILIENFIMVALRMLGVSFNKLVSSLAIILYFTPIHTILIMITKEENVKPQVKFFIKVFIAFTVIAYVLAMIGEIVARFK